MTQLTANFHRSEFACRCGCGFDDIDIRLVDLLQQVRDFFDVPVAIISGCRCEEHNRKIGGAPRSQHLYGKAADFRVLNVPPSVVYEFCDAMNPGGLGSYATFTHMDVRDGRARW